MKIPTRNICDVFAAGPASLADCDCFWTFGLLGLFRWLWLLRRLVLIGFCTFFRKQRLLRIILKGFVFLLSAEEPHFKDGTPLDLGISINFFSNLISLGL